MTGRPNAGSQTLLASFKLTKPTPRHLAYLIWTEMTMITGEMKRVRSEFSANWLQLIWLAQHVYTSAPSVDVHGKVGVEQ